MTKIAIMFECGGMLSCERQEELPLNSELFVWSKEKEFDKWVWVKEMNSFIISGHCVLHSFYAKHVYGI